MKKAAGNMVFRRLFSCRVPRPQDVATWEGSGTTGPILSGGRIYGEARDQNLLVNSMSGQSF
ncbi:hypothetical protein BGC30_14465 [Novacetimonas hansenii]|nr:hypothetical protein BGC30_14465 [Novacetimonas hansenii]